VALSGRKRLGCFARARNDGAKVRTNCQKFLLLFSKRRLTSAFSLESKILLFVNKKKQKNFDN
jgi:hypothetical protein